MKKILQAIAPYAVVVLIFFLALTVAKRLDNAHDAKHAFVSDRFQIIEVKTAGLYGEAIIYDTETGIRYLWARAGYGGGITPLLDANGNVTYYHSENP